MKIVKIGKISIGGGNPICLIAGPCVIESEESALFHADRIKKITSKVGINFIFKSSFDKANRSSIESFRGIGITKGLKILKTIKQKLGVPVLSDVHCKSEIKEAAKVLDIIQIPALLSRQTDLIVAAAITGKPINVKKGQFLAPWDMKNVIEKIEQSGNKNILLTERGTSFGYNNLVSDMRSLPIMRSFGYPVIFDATHSVQLPGAGNKCSYGQSEFISVLTRAAVASGCDGIFIEVHRQPEKALCDGPNSLRLNDLEEFLTQIKRIDQIIREENLK